MTTQQNSAHVSVHLTDCAPQDADTVFDALKAVFPSPVDQEIGEHCERLPGVANPMVWIKTYDVRTRARSAEPPALGEAVTADLFGAHRPVQQIEQALTQCFRVEEEGHIIPGDQEVQIRLRLSRRTLVPS